MAANEQQENQPAPAGDEAQKAFDAETSGFAKSKVVQQQWAKERDAVIGNAQPSAEALAAETATTTEGEKADGQVGVDDAADENAADGAAKAAEGDAAGTADAGAEGEGGKADDAAKAGEIPKWLSDRVKRVSEKERTVDTGAQQLEAQRQELADREAAVTAREKAASLTKPDPDAFDDVAEYDAAKVEYDAAQLAAKNAEAKVKKPAQQEQQQKPPALPLGLTPQDMLDASNHVASQIPASMVDKLAGKDTVLPHAVLIELAAQPTKEGTEQLTRFILGNQETIKLIAKLPPVQQGAALVRAYNEKPPAEPKRKSNAPEPISPVNGSGLNTKNLAAASFGDFEAAVNKAEAEARKKGSPSNY